MTGKGRKSFAAAALRYDEKRDDAPAVTASGRGETAERIVRLARESNIPVVEDAALVSALLVLELGEEIPLGLYEAVAKILAMLYTIDKGDAP
ncbi:EscU/YscU/HrcU family type III secretion system export apparatus switch protein [Aminivibrio sp.]